MREKHMWHWFMSESLIQSAKWWGPGPANTGNDTVMLILQTRGRSSLDDDGAGVEREREQLVVEKFFLDLSSVGREFNSH